MKKSIYRILKLLAVLWISFHGTVAFAEEEPLIMMYTGTDSTGIDTTYYTSFPDALKVANKSPHATMVLLSDVRFEGKATSQVVRTNLTIDLNGYTLGDTLVSTSLISLGVDTLTLHVFSSRPGGRIAVSRDFNGRIYAISCNKGRLLLDHIAIEARNTAVYNADTCRNVAVTAVTVGASTTMQMNACRVYASADGSVTAVTGSGNAVSSAQMNLRSCFFRAEGGLRVYGVTCYGTVGIADCDVEVSASANPAYGLYIYNRYDSVLMQDVRGTIHNTRVRVSSLKQAYGIYSNAPLTVSDDSVRTITERESSYALYTNRDTALFVLSRSQFIAEAGATSAYSAYVGKGRIEAEDCLFSGTARQDTAHLPAESGARGITAGAHCDLALKHCTVRAAGTNPEAARGACALTASSTSRLTVRGCDITAQGAENTTALRGSGDKSSSAVVDIRDCRLKASSGKTAYGINCYNTVSLSDCSIDVSASGNSAYGVYLSQYIDTAMQSVTRASVKRCAVTVSALRQGYGIYSRAGMDMSGDTVSVYTTQSEAYALYTNTSGDSIMVRDCRLMSEAPEKNYFLNRNTNMEGRLFFYNGYYSHDTNLRMYMPEGYGLYRLYDGEEYQSGYRYTIQPVAKPDAVVARMYNTRTGAHIADYKRVADALWYANFHAESELTIVVVADCQLNWSTYIVPQNTTLVIGYKEGQKSAIGTSALRSEIYSIKRQCFARLEMLDDAELIVEGVLEISGVQQVEGTICGSLSGEFGYGQLHLAPTASVVLEQGARLQAWGYITGSGTINARSGASVYEFLQLGDWKGGTVTYGMVNNRYKVFPFTHFFYQNIESPVVYHAGSKAFGSTMISVSSYTSVHDNIRLLGDQDALFTFPDNDPDATIRKEYDPETDRIIWTTDGNISLDQLGLYLNFGIEGKYSLVSSQYVLPLGTNMTIRAHTGTLEIKHDVMMPPGTQVTIGPEAGIHIPEDVSLYLFDTDQWSWYGTSETGYATVSYSPSWNVCPRDTALADARMEIGGTALVDGALYTTASGAAVVGTDDAAGRVIFTKGALPDGAVYLLTGTYDVHQYTPSVATMPALLNADNSRTMTKKATEGAVYTYTDGIWFSADTTADLLPDTIPTDTIPVDTVPIPIGGDSIEGMTIPRSSRIGRRILENGIVYILTPDGRRYTLLGLPGRKEEIQ